MVYAMYMLSTAEPSVTHSADFLAFVFPGKNVQMCLYLKEAFIVWDYCPSWGGRQGHRSQSYHIRSQEAEADGAQLTFSLFSVKDPRPWNH